MEQLEVDQARESWSSTNHSRSDSQRSKADSGVESLPLIKPGHLTEHTRGPGTDHPRAVSKANVSHQGHRVHMGLDLKKTKHF